MIAKLGIMVVVKAEVNAKADTSAAVNPCSWVVVSCCTSNCSRLVVEIKANCKGLRAEIWVVLNPLAAVVLSPLSVLPVRADIWVESSQATWVVVRLLRVGTERPLMVAAAKAPTMVWVRLWESANAAT